MNSIRALKKNTRIRLSPADKRELILETAAQLFLEHGFSGMRINDLIEQVGGSKTNFYTHFESKEALFNAVTERLISQVMDPLKQLGLDSSRSMKDALTEAALQMHHTLFSERGVRLQLILYWECQNGRVSGREAYLHGPAGAVDLLAAYFDDHRSSFPNLAGKQRQAANHFLGLVIYPPMLQYFCALPQTGSARTQANAVRRAVKHFLELLPHL